MANLAALPAQAGGASALTSPSITRTIEITPSPGELGKILGAYDDYSQADILAAAVEEMSSGGTDHFASEVQALFLARRIPTDSRTAQWLRALVGFIDGKEDAYYPRDTCRGFARANPPRPKPAQRKPKTTKDLTP